MLTIPINALTRLFQVLDGSFPSGTFVHSFGLEPHVILGHIQTIDSLRQYIHNVFYDQYELLEIVVIFDLFRLLKLEKFNVIAKREREYSAMLSYEYAKASKTIGENYLSQLKNILCSHKEVEQYRQRIFEDTSLGHECVVLSLLAYDLGIDKHTFYAIWVKRNLITIAMSALKISRIKPSEIQQMLFELDELLAKEAPSMPCVMTNFNPLFESVIFQHASLEPKLFMT